MRVGSWDYLQWKHITPIKKNNAVVAAKIILVNTKINNRLYFSFITPEAYHSLKEKMDFLEFQSISIKELEIKTILIKFSTTYEKYRKMK